MNFKNFKEINTLYWGEDYYEIIGQCALPHGNNILRITAEKAAPWKQTFSWHFCKENIYFRKKKH